MKKPMRKRMTIMLAIVGFVFAAIIGYQMFVASMMKQFLSSNAQPPATVTAMQVTEQEWQPQLSAVGSLRAVQGVEISAEIAGIVKKVHFKSGEVVKKGDLLLELNSAEELAQLESLRASRKLAEINFKRDQRQFKVHAISKAQLDASEAELTSKRAQQAQQQAIIDKKRILAPFAGRLGVSTLNPGQYLNPADKIVSLQNIRALYVDFNMPQKHVEKLKQGQNINILLQQSGADPVAGKITTINNIVDQSTRNVRVEGLIDNADGILLPGMFVNVKIETGSPEKLLTLPQTAISFNAYGSTLFVAREVEAAADTEEKALPVAQQLFVKTGDKRGDQVAILDGLKPGELVVTSGQMKLKNGTPLIINNEVLPANDAAPKPQEQ
ncbi:membrane fusion protein, multidrug efflux system [Mariprofundus micogutta]|uniref:Membrane fusion protein, multidrug efflux system n=1 Tax=Mariprofundus micogutta TaxID=1921010 RepID=A0A1L8CMJ5_9PROT|nr:efflux RND transporter periplasmic adaptor subunit [Mariprofundus micogutta]GAV20124.1 membrane fusion protein, multidrug efflux system [Mariprofundus micogutta]